MRRNGWWFVVVIVVGVVRSATAQDTRALTLEAAREAQWAMKWTCPLRATEVMRAVSAMAREGSDEARAAELRRARHAMRGCAQNVSTAYVEVASAPSIRGRFRAPDGATRVEGPGRFDPRLVARMIQTRQAAIRACYERELRTTRELAGTVVLAIRIDERGSVDVDALPESTLPNTAVLECARSVAARFRFTPGPEGGPFTAVMTLTFEPHSP